MMSRLLYYCVIIPISWMPFFILHGLSDIFYFILYRIVGYRKKVVFGNLRNSFPGKPDAELKKIASGFYHFLCDLLLEGFKAFSLTERNIRTHLKVNDPELINRYFREGRSVIIAIGHYNSWEMFLAGLDSFLQHDVYVIYQPLTDRFLDEKLHRSREEHGTHLLSTKNVREFFSSKHERPTATVFAIDQSPPGPDRCYWMEFLHQETGVLFGTEKFAKDLNQPVLYVCIRKEKRGHYSLDIKLVTDDPRNTAYGEITEKATRMLEEDIRNEPRYWLWSHKRWKHSRPQAGADSGSGIQN